MEQCPCCADCMPPDFQGAVDRFLEALHQNENASPQEMIPYLCEVLAEEFKKMSASDLYKYYKELTLHPAEYEVRLTLAFPIKNSQSPDKD